MAYTYFPNAILFLCALLFTAFSHSLKLYGFSDYWNNSKNIKLFFININNRVYVKYNL